VLRCCPGICIISWQKLTISILSREVPMNYEFGEAIVTNTSENPGISSRMIDWSLLMMQFIFVCWNTMKLGRWAPTFRMSVLFPSSEYERFWRWCQDGDSIFLRHVGACVPNFTASHFRRQVFMVISVGTISDVFTNLASYCHFWLRSVGWYTDSVNWKGCVEKRSWPVCLERRWGELGRIRTRSRKQREREASGVEAGLLLADGGVLQTLLL